MTASTLASASIWSDDLTHRPKPTGMSQWWTLTARVLKMMLFKGELLIAVIIPLIFTLSFYLPLKFVMSLGGIDYAQYVMPIIVLQSMGFTAMSTAQRSAAEAMTGLTARIQTMPVAPLAMIGARIVSGFVRSSVALGASIGYGYWIGFRFNDVAQGALFCAFALGVSVVLSLGADALGTLTKSPAAVSQAITLPYLILGMLSSGFTPVDRFPDWIEPFVRNQPITHFAYVLRDLAAGGVTAEVALPALLWLGALAAILVPLGLWAGTRRE